MKKNIVLTLIIAAVAGFSILTYKYISGPSEKPINNTKQSTHSSTAANDTQPKTTASDRPQKNSGHSETSEVSSRPGDAAKPQEPVQAKPVIKPVDIKNVKSGTIKGDGVNVRAESHIAQNNSVAKLNRGEVVEVVGAERPSTDKHRWIKVKLKNGKTGFVRDDLIELKEK